MSSTPTTQAIEGSSRLTPINVHPGVELIEGYRLVKYLGRGGFGEVWETEAPGGLSKAIKLAPMENTNAALNCRELEGLKKIRAIRHPFLLSIERFEILDGYLAIVMELADKNLTDRFDECVEEGLPGIPRDELMQYMREASEVLDLMSQQYGLQHLDIKPENLFLLGKHVKVADFGLVQSGNTNMSRSAMAISPPYAPPELFDGRIEPTADQYGLAVSYQELLTGRRPYDATDVRGLMLQHLRGRPNLSALPPGDRTVMSQALQRDVTSRFGSCTEFVEALQRAASFGAPIELKPKPPAEEEAKPKPGAKSRAKSAGPKPLAVGLKQMKPARSSRSDSDTASLTGKSSKMQPVVQEPGAASLSADKRVRSTFVAFLPLKIYAHKLRGFIDALDAEIVHCDDDDTLLAFRSRGWFGMKSSKAVFMELNSCTRSETGAFRVVDVSVWSTGNRWQGQELIRRGILLIRCLKEFLMATDVSADGVVLKSTNQIKEEILG